MNHSLPDSHHPSHTHQPIPSLPPTATAHSPAHASRPSLQLQLTPSPHDRHPSPSRFPEQPIPRGAAPSSKWAAASSPPMAAAFPPALPWT
ncbi:hypothetical protein WBG25_11480 [Xylella fastidiosa subsp. multiplex]